MYVCQCMAVTDTEVRCAIEKGARDPDEIGVKCGAGTECGGCTPLLMALLADCAGGHDRQRQVPGRFAA